MEIAKTGRFITDFYGSQPALGATEVLGRYLQGNVDKALLSFGEQIKKKGQNAHEAVAEVLSIFNMNANQNPIIGNWMLQRCLVNTGLAIFNAMKDRSHPKQDAIHMGVSLVLPVMISLSRDGKLIERADEIKTYTVSITKPKRSFFKAYEVIKTGAVFECKITFDDEAFTKDHMNLILSKCGYIGIGAYRQRFGKFEWIN